MRKENEEDQCKSFARSLDFVMNNFARVLKISDIALRNYDIEKDPEIISSAMRSISDLAGKVMSWNHDLLEIGSFQYVICPKCNHKSSGYLLPWISDEWMCEMRIGAVDCDKCKYRFDVEVLTIINFVSRGGEYC